jgi:hypothetical protein
MGRLHSNGKGISASAVPYSRNPPAWLKTTPEQVVEQIQKLAKKGATPSQIGEILRDSHGIAQTKGKFCHSKCEKARVLTFRSRHRKQDPPYPQVQRYDSLPQLKRKSTAALLLSICRAI